ncbi:MAG: NAD-dependent epimerase/dehydratase family protein, partial [Solirubrobacteraceae bacterium]|nr:NAD-dependent epimerase/dehydratase family protein [Solirubrobacteraceae bacterium]
MPENDVCLITGATGFIGGHIARRLLADGQRVRCLVRAGSDSAALAEHGAEIATGDLTDPSSLGRAVAGCGAVVHCAAMVSDWALVAEIARANV